VSQVLPRGVMHFLAVLAAGFALGVIGIAVWHIFGYSKPAQLCD
jgi:hypothetical protein